MDPRPQSIMGEGKKNGAVATKIFLCLSFVCVLFVIFCLIKVVPTFEDVFASFGAKLPWPTALAVGLSQNLQKPLGYGITLVSFLLFVVFSVRTWDGMPPLVAFGLLIGWVMFLGFIIVAMFLPMFTLGSVKG